MPFAYILDQCVATGYFALVSFGHMHEEVLSLHIYP